MTALAPRTQLGPYEILEEIGRGGMGKVYKARDTRLNRIVAVKVSSGEYDKRFKREARAVAALNHPCICTIYDVGPNYIVMEYIDGTPLRGPASADEVLPYAMQICDALAAAHEKGITHRDLKPDNILLTRSGIKLLDFGLAKVRTSPRRVETASETRMGTILGTPHYMSPEQAQGGAVDARSDIFSFGSLLYELLTGRKAFPGSDALCVLASILRDEPAPMECAPEMQAVIARCLRKIPIDRYQSAADLRAALEDCARHSRSDRPIADGFAVRLLAGRAGNWPASEEPGETAPEAAASSASFVRFSSGLGVWGAFLLLALTCAWIWRFATGDEITIEPAIQRITATMAENRVTAAAVSPDGTRLAYAELGGTLVVQDLQSSRRALLPAPERTLIETISWMGKEGKILISGETDAGRRMLWTEDTSDSRLRLLRQDAQHGIVSPDGQLLAFTSGEENEIWVMKSNGREARRLVIGGNDDTFPFIAFSADSRRLSYQRRHYLTDSVDRHTRADGENNFKRTLETVDLSGKIVETAVMGVASGCMLADGRMLYLQLEEGSGHDFNVWELRTDPGSGKHIGRPRRLTRWREKYLAGISCSTDGSFVGFQVKSSQSDIYLAGSGTGRSVRDSLQDVRRLTQEDIAEYPHAWTADSGAVIFEKPGKTGWDLYIQAIDNRLAYPLATEEGSKIMPQSSPDGEWLLYCFFRDGSAKARARQTLRRVPIRGGPWQLVPTGQFDEFRCALQAGKGCVLRTIENRQYVYWDLDPIRGRGRELVRTAWAPPILGDWALSADGTEAAVPVHDPHEARIRLIALNAPPENASDTRDLLVPGLGGLIGLIADANNTGWFATATSPRGVKLLHIDRSGQTQLLRECPNTTWGLPSPDGKRIAFVDQAAISNFWSVPSFR